MDIYLMDITLRDGEQAVGVIFSRWEKLQIASHLAQMGIPAIEAGFPALGPEEKEAIRGIVVADLQVGESQRPLEVYAFVRARREDVQDAAECGVHGVVISISTSDIHIERKFRATRSWVLERMEEAADEARKHDLPFIVSAEDASRSDMGFLTEYYRRAEALGAWMVRYCDSLGINDPFTTYRHIRELCRVLSVPIQLHMHNDFGMATANALMGLRAGARAVAASLGGLGERTGNSPLEEVVMALKHLYGVDLGVDTTRFREAAEYIAEASRRAIPIWKAIIGSSIFAHESGIHADGILKHPHTYEAFSPEEVNLERQIVIGKHSGTHALIHKFSTEFGIQLDSQTASGLLERVRAAAVELKRPLFDKELMLLYRELANRRAP
ncbi:MAG: homocitrate synthase family protein [Anaerolineae bacterium]|nr:homocitrate synthase family protein [Anaerolineae bacterium]MDW7992856.1 homocitrate synthase family protein [Anaerolineae bacterium]